MLDFLFTEILRFLIDILWERVIAPALYFIGWLFLKLISFSKLKIQPLGMMLEKEFSYKLTIFTGFLVIVGIIMIIAAFIFLEL